MAELHVQKKERSVWPWILLVVIVIALLFWWLAGRDEGMDLSTTGVTDSTLVGEAPATTAMDSASGRLDGNALASYEQFLADRSSRAAGVAHDYTADGLRRLAAAIDEVAGGDSVGGVALQPRIAEIRQRADAMQRAPNSDEHALMAREAFVLASSVIAQMDSTRGGANAAMTSSLRESAMDIEPSVPLLDQTDKIEQFFERAGNAFRGSAQ